LCEILVPADYDIENNLSLKPLRISDVSRKGKTKEREQIMWLLKQTVTAKLKMVSFAADH